MPQAMTKTEAREMFGWVPKNERGTPSLINSLKQRGIETKEQIKEYMRTTGMPAQDMGLKSRLDQRRAMKEAGQKATIKPSMTTAQAKAKFNTPKMQKPAATVQKQEQGLQQEIKLQMKQ